jgi:hypothetical protein
MELYPDLKTLDLTLGLTLIDQIRVVTKAPPSVPSLTAAGQIAVASVVLAVGFASATRFSS